jgi:UrcA family protein
MKSMTTLVALATFALSNVSIAHSDMTQCRSETLKFADLDVTTVDGAAALFQRLGDAAERVCRNPLLGRSPDWTQAYSHCVHDALGGAVAKVNTPAVVAFARQHGVYPLTDKLCN